MAIINGTSGNDTLVSDGDTIGDSVYGLEGNDSIAGGSNSADTLYGGAGNDTILSYQNSDAFGGDGNDVIRKNGYSGRLDGGVGDDLIDLMWSTQAFTIEGGLGNDTVNLNFDSAKFFLVNNGEGYVLLGPDYGFVAPLSGVEVLTFKDATDALSHEGLGDFLDGTAGDDTLSGTVHGDWLMGHDGNDSLDGGQGDDLIQGGEGDNVLTGGQGDDLIEGSYGDDVLTGAAGNDTINGGGGDDSLDGGLDSDVLDGGDGNDTILGGSRWDTLTGGAGDDVLDGGTENDRMYGNAGNDTYYVDHVGDRVLENANEGIDTVYAAIDWALSPDVEHLFLTGAAISGTGNGLNNRITGNVNANILNGGNGNDTLVGGQGNDGLTGGTGRDDFVFAAAAANGTDSITDFVHGVDRLVFSGADYGFMAGHRLTAAQFTAGTAATGTSAQFVWDASSGRLYWDADGSGAGAAIDLAGITGGANVTKDDLFFV